MKTHVYQHRLLTVIEQTEIKCPKQPEPHISVYMSAFTHKPQTPESCCFWPLIFFFMPLKELRVAY